MLREGSRRLQVRAATLSVFAIVGLVLVVASEASQRISRSRAKNSMFELFHYWTGLPKPFDFAQKRKIVANPPCGKRRSCGAVDTTVKPEKRVKNHPNVKPTLNFFAVACEHNGNFLRHNQYISWELLKNIIGGTKSIIDPSLMFSPWTVIAPLGSNYNSIVKLLYN